MISITAPVFDIDGLIIVEQPDVDGLSTITRRSSRIATLDGRAAFNDFGYSDADRILTIAWRPKSQAETDNIIRMIKTYSRLILASREGCFIGAPDDFRTDDNTVQFKLHVERRLDL